MAIHIAPLEDIQGILSILHPMVRDFFRSNFPTPTPPQMVATKPISEGRNVLVAAPTGSGKTFAAFLPILSKLMGLADNGLLQDSVYCVYVSPLRTLNGDIAKNIGG